MSTDELHNLPRDESDEVKMINAKNQNVRLAPGRSVVQRVTLDDIGQTFADSTLTSSSPRFGQTALDDVMPCVVHLAHGHHKHQHCANVILISFHHAMQRVLRFSPLLMVCENMLTSQKKSQRAL